MSIYIYIVCKYSAKRALIYRCRYITREEISWLLSMPNTQRATYATMHDQISHAVIQYMLHNLYAYYVIHLIGNVRAVREEERCNCVSHGSTTSKQL